MNTSTEKTTTAEEPFRVCVRRARDSRHKMSKKSTGGGSTQELLSRIRDLELENMELKSKLDQYQV